MRKFGVLCLLPFFLLLTDPLVSLLNPHFPFTVHRNPGSCFWQAGLVIKEQSMFMVVLV